MTESSLVRVVKDEPMVGTFSIAKGFGRQHKRVIEIIDKHKGRFLRLGNKSVSNGLIIVKHKATKAGRPVEEYMLNEKQAMFLGTLFRNLNDTVLDFKENLADAFVETKRALLNLQREKLSPQWRNARLESVMRRKDTTDVIQSFVDYAKAQGSEHSDKYYMIISKMINSLLFVVDGKYSSLRDTMTGAQLMTVGAAEGIVTKTLTDGMKNKVYYKDIFQKAKTGVQTFADLHGMSDVVDKQLKLL